MTALGMRSGSEEQQIRAVAMRLQAGSEFTFDQLFTAARFVAQRNDPLRDAIVLREAKRLTTAIAELGPVWEQVSGRLRGQLPSTSFELWLEPLRPFGEQGSTLMLSAPDHIRAWTRRRYTGLIREALHSIGSPYTDVEFVEGAACP